MQDGSPQRPRTLRSLRLRSLVWGALGILALAAVIFAVSALSAPKNPSPRPASATTKAQEDSRRLYDEALGALASGETTLATSLLDRAVAADPGNAEAKKKRTEIADPGLPKNGDEVTPPSDTPGNGNESGPKEDPAFAGPIADMGRLLPVSIAGLSPGATLVQQQEAQLAFDPATPAMESRVSRVLVTVHDFGSAQKAVTFTTTLAGKAYAQNRTTVTVKGTAAKAVFGSDGRHLAAILFTRGRFAYEIVITSSGPDPGTLLDLATTVAGSLPVKP